MIRFKGTIEALTEFDLALRTEKVRTLGVITGQGASAHLDVSGEHRRTALAILRNDMKGAPITHIDTPVSGEGATIVIGSDRRPATVIECAPSHPKIHKGEIHWCRIQEDKAIRTDKNGMSDSQTYRFEKDPKGRIYDVVIRGRKDPKWRTVQDDLRVDLGARDAHYDYSF